jgi:hypothetical protein
MLIEFFPDGNDDCPAIVFYGCPSAGAAALINAFRSLAEGREVEVALHQLPGITPVGDIRVFALDWKLDARVQQFSTLAFRWRKDKEGWFETAELVEPVAHSEPNDRTRFQYIERNGKVNIIFSTNRAW